MSRAHIEMKLNDFAADGYRCISFTAMQGDRGKTQYIAVMERPVGRIGSERRDLQARAYQGAIIDRNGAIIRIAE